MDGLAVRRCLSLTRRVLEAALAARSNKADVAQVRVPKIGPIISPLSAWIPGSLRIAARPQQITKTHLPFDTHQAASRRHAPAEPCPDPLF